MKRILRIVLYVLIGVLLGAVVAINQNSFVRERGSYIYSENAIRFSAPSALDVLSLLRGDDHFAIEVFNEIRENEKWKAFDLVNGAELHFPLLEGRVPNNEGEIKYEAIAGTDYCIGDTIICKEQEYHVVGIVGYQNIESVVCGYVFLPCALYQNEESIQTWILDGKQQTVKEAFSFIQEEAVQQDLRVVQLPFSDYGLREIYSKSVLESPIKRLIFGMLVILLSFDFLFVALENRRLYAIILSIGGSHISVCKLYAQKHILPEAGGLIMGTLLSLLLHRGQAFAICLVMSQFLIISMMTALLSAFIVSRRTERKGRIVEDIT